ncbi:MAG: tetratricopeptide repeat protein [Sphingobacteriales bacterium]|nr:MAG: tetratricopeptide repeat protein [Sphingobacteriales bacterium]
MRKVHFISILASAALIAALFFLGNTKPPKPTKEEGTAQGPVQGGQGMQPQHAPPASTDSILTASRAQLPAHAVTEIDSIAKQLAGIQDSAKMAPVFTTLAKEWQQHKQLPVAAYYYAKAAKLENSEKKLNFAGQFFLDLVHETSSESVRMWEAEQAAACFQRSLELDPNNDTTKMALAATYIEGVGETMQGVQILLGITREKPDNIPANLMLGRMAVQSGQFDKAIKRFETILKLEPKNTEALYFLAEAYKGKGNKEKAIELFEECKKIVNKPEFSSDIDNYIKSFK